MYSTCSCFFIYIVKGKDYEQIRYQKRRYFLNMIVMGIYIFCLYHTIYYELSVIYIAYLSNIRNIGFNDITYDVLDKRIENASEKCL